MVSKVLLALLALSAAVAVTSGNPAAGTPWHWINLHPKLAPNSRGLPVVHYPSSHDGEAPRIVGGQEAVPHSFPWQVALFIDNIYFCGGSLISENFVVTAAHCLHNHKKVEVVAGAHNIRRKEDSQVSMISNNFTVHEGWSRPTIQNDIGLIKLPEPMPMNDNIRPINLPAHGSAKLPVGEIVSPSGWGKTSFIGGISKVLMTVDAPVGNHRECAQIYGAEIVTDNVICLDTTGGHGVCSGDSGGPMNHVEGDKDVIRGIVSFGPVTCARGFPDGFTDIVNYLDWLENLMKY